MAFLSNEKLLIVGAGGMIGSNMVQSALMLGLTPNICLYDIYEPGVHGVFDEMQQCAFPGANLSYTVDPKEAFTGAKYIISSGGAPRKDGMTREDLLKGNCKIAAEFGDNIKKYCPDVEHVVVIFNPADVTALTLPAGCYVNCDKCGFKNVMMAMPSTIDKTGVHFTEPAGTEEEMASLAKSYEHLCKMRDEIVELGIVPAVEKWNELNPNL